MNHFVHRSGDSHSASSCRAALGTARVRRFRGKVLALAALATLGCGVASALGQCVTTTNVQPQVGNVPAYRVECVYDTAGARVLALSQAPPEGGGVQVYAYNVLSWTTLPRLGTLPPGERRYSGVWTYDTTRGEALAVRRPHRLGHGHSYQHAQGISEWHVGPSAWTGVSPHRNSVFM